MVDLTQMAPGSVKEDVGKAKPRQEPDKAMQIAWPHWHCFVGTPAQGSHPLIQLPAQPHGAPWPVHFACLAWALAIGMGSRFPLDNALPAPGGRIDGFLALLER